MLDRKNPYSAIPQLEKKIDNISTEQTDIGLDYSAFKEKTKHDLIVIDGEIVDNNALIIEERERAIGVEETKADADSVYDKSTTDSMVDEASTMATDFIAPSTVGQTADDCIKVFPKAEKSNPQNYVQIDSDSVDIVKGGLTVAEYSQGLTVWSDNGTGIAHLGYGTTEGASGQTASPYYDLGIRKSGTTIGSYSVAEGGATTASSLCSHAEGRNTVASGWYAHAEGNLTTASGSDAHAEGYSTTASGSDAHAEGDHTTASGSRSHAEGYHTTASGYESHAEGEYTTASGSRSHAEGNHTTARGDYSHAQGKYNVPNTSHADIVGNGTADNARSNAYALDWNGNGYFAGDVYVGCNADSSGGTKLVNSSDIVITGHKVFDNNLSMGAGTYKEFTTTVSKVGYKPVAIAGFGPYNDGGSGSSYVTAVAVYIIPNTDNSCTISLMLRNPTSSSVSNVSYSVYVTWQKI